MNSSLRQIQKKLQKETEVYRCALHDPRTPRSARWLLGMALGYLALPFDLIPDMIPVLGWIDDAIIVPGLVYLAVQQIPEEVMQECRRQIMSD